MPKQNGDGSSEFKIFETREFTRSLEKLPAREALLIRKKLLEYVYPQIKVLPFAGANIKKLRNYTPEVWRYRIGRFRVFYTVAAAQRTIYLLSVEYRRDAYR